MLWLYEFMSEGEKNYFYMILGDWGLKKEIAYLPLLLS